MRREYRYRKEERALAKKRHSCRHAPQLRKETGRRGPTISLLDGDRAGRNRYLGNRKTCH